MEKQLVVIVTNDNVHQITNHQMIKTSTNLDFVSTCLFSKSKIMISGSNHKQNIYMTLWIKAVTNDDAGLTLCVGQFFIFLF